MLGDTIDIKKDEKRYNQLLNEGVLPGAVIKRIENEKRLGITTDTGSGFGDLDIGFPQIAIAGIVLILGYSILKGKTSSAALAMNVKSIDDIVGIDLVALKECRENGLM